MKNITLSLIILIMSLNSFAQAENSPIDSIAAAVGQDTFQDPGQPGIMMKEDRTLVDDGNSLPYVSTLSSKHEDPYVATVSGQLAASGFKARGYNNSYYESYFNGLLMNDVKTGSSFSNSGLNDAFHLLTASYGLKPGDAGSGGAGGSLSQDYSAAAQRKQTIVSYTQANRFYNNRIMVAYHTGTLKNGWAVSLAAARRWADMGYVEGTGNNNDAYCFGVSKRVGGKSLLHFFTLGSAGTTALAGTAVQEVYDLAGTSFYNPLWGYQKGEKRNADIGEFYQPLYVLQYEYKPDNCTHVQLCFAYQVGYTQTSGLDWYNAPDPRPDYYKKLPSYYTNDPAIANSQQADALRQLWLIDPASRQIEWDNLYEVNRLSAVGGQPGCRSVYVLGADREDSRKYNIAASFRKIIGAHIKVNTGTTLIAQHTESYRKMIDLLGGDYYLNLNPFAEQTYPASNTMKQVDLNEPDRMVRVGDKYGHNYISRFIRSFIWTDVSFNFGKADFFLSARLGYDAFGREGLYRNGLFPDSSFGKSAVQEFVTWQLKGGIACKISLEQNIFLNAGLLNNAPAWDHTFISPKTRNSVVNNISTEQVATFEAGYLLTKPKVHGRASIFATNINDATDIRRFYYEGYNTFVNYVMQHINIQHMGAELALQVKVTPSLMAVATATWMQIFYRSNPQGSLYRDNDTITQVAQHITYLKNYNAASGPQSAYTFGFTYQSAKKWQAGINFNLTDRNYVEINPLRHTEEAVNMLQAGTSQHELVLMQEKLPSAFTADIFMGRTFYLSKVMKWLPRRTNLSITGGISNLFNRKDIRTKGYDQLRFDYGTQNPAFFPAKYTYGYGATYFVKCALRF